MLLSLYIQNIALMDEMQAEFSAGFHVLTGETGAGKSILVDAITLLLGGRAQKELIRAGCEKARVEGVFGLDDCPAALRALSEQDIDCEEGEVILSREITLAGRSSCRVNGVLLPLAQYQAITAHLMDIHGQHAHQSLMDEKKHLGFLDETGDEAHRSLIRAAADACNDWRQAARELEKWRKTGADAQERAELLQIRVRELKDANLQPGEEETLTLARDKFRNAEKIESGLREAYDAVYAGSAPAAEALQSAVRRLGPIEGLDPAYAAIRARLDGLYYEVEDAGLSLRELLNHLDSDPDKLEEVQARLDMIRRLSRKYGGADTGAMLARLQEMEQELSGYENLDETIAALEKKEKQAAEGYRLAARALTESRQALARQFEKEIEGQLRDLNMAGTKFSVRFTPCPPSATGSETAAFLIAPNRGEELQPLSKIASGGELSRLMLAIKSVAAEREGVPSMIFDEIDTGISGRAAQVVGQKMAAIARRHQVLCVTNLQQIAALVDHHFLVEKYFDGGRTKTRLTPLSGDARADEIARMLGGDPDSARAHAREMLRQAQELNAAPGD